MASSVLVMNSLSIRQNWGLLPNSMPKPSDDAGDDSEAGDSAAAAANTSRRASAILSRLSTMLASEPDIDLCSVIDQTWQENCGNET